jgi:hypothetical protein
VLPRWLGWAAIVIAILAGTPIAFAGFIGAALFVLVVSVMLAMREREARTPPPTAPPPAATTP